jgi:hypothetical protein
MMKEKRRVITLDDGDHSMVITALNDLRNRKLEERKPTDAVDDVLLKTIDAPSRRVRVRVRDDEAR